MLGVVATAPVAKGAECFATYGHGWWQQSEQEATDTLVTEAFTARAREADLWVWQVAFDKNAPRHHRVGVAYKFGPSAVKVYKCGSHRIPVKTYNRASGSYTVHCGP